MYTPTVTDLYRGLSEKQVGGSVGTRSGDWLIALHASSCGLQLGNEAIQVAVGVRLGVRRYMRSIRVLVAVSRRFRDSQLYLM